MHILVLDTIHGGKEIGDTYADAGNVVDVVDVYTGTTQHFMQVRSRSFLGFLSAILSA